MAPAVSNVDSLRDLIDSDVPHASVEDLADLEMLASVAEQLGAVVAELLGAVVAAELPGAVVAELPGAVAVEEPPAAAVAELLAAAVVADKVGVLAVAGLLVAVAAAELRDALAIVHKFGAPVAGQIGAVVAAAVAGLQDALIFVDPSGAVVVAVGDKLGALAAEDTCRCCCCGAAWLRMGDAAGAAILRSAESGRLTATLAGRPWLTLAN